MKTSYRFNGVHPLNVRFSFIARVVVLLLAAHAPQAALHAQSDFATPYTFTTFAGRAASGDNDGTGSAARFRAPHAVAVDAAGNVYVADSMSNTIRRITSGGVVTTVAGLAGNRGAVDGPGSAAQFNGPSGLAVDGSGNIFVADRNNCTIRKITSAGVVTTLAGSAGIYGSTDGNGTTAQFANPNGVAVDGAGNVYVADTGNHTIRKITPEGLVSTLSGSAGSFGSTDAAGSAARFKSPMGVAVDGAGIVYVADTLNDSVRRIAADGMVSTLAGQAGSAGPTDGAAGVARFFGPQGVAVDGAGNLYVADTASSRIRKITPSGVASTYTDTSGSKGWTVGMGNVVQFSDVRGVAVDGSGDVYVADFYSYVIRKISADGALTTLAGASSAGVADGLGSAAQFNMPFGVAVSAAGTIYVSDGYSNTIRKITVTGEVTTFAGSAGSSGSTDATGSAARFAFPFGVAVDVNGTVYVADTGNATIRKITSSGEVTTLAGLANSTGSNDGTGSAARFNAPYGVAVDGSGNVYVADNNNKTIRKITPSGEVTTLAGLAGSAGSIDGTGSAARFNAPYGVAVDGSGNVYVADFYNNSIRKVTSAGVVTTFAPASGSATEFVYPQGVAVDGSGNVFVLDTGVRRVSSNGMVTSLAGGSLGSIDGTGSVAQFNHPVGIAVDGAGRIYVADTQNNTIRVGILAPPILTSATESVGLFGQTFSYTAAFSGSPSVFSVNGLPPGLDFDTATGVLSGVPTAAGVFTVTLGATNGAGSSSTGFMLTVQKANQTITFGALANKSFGDIPFAVSATASSGLSPTFSIVSGPATISGNLVTITGRGTVVIRASQDGDSNYTAATSVDQSLTIAGTSYTFTTLAGEATYGSTDGTGSGARFYNAQGVAVDSAGNVYVADTTNFTIRKITAAGVVSTFAGSAGIGGSTDGTGSAARFWNPQSVAVDSAGNVYVADTNNQTIRKIIAAGVVTTLAGNAQVVPSFADGVGTTAHFSNPQGVAVDSAGNVYVADSGNNAIRKITPAGVVTTLAGSPGSSGSTDGIGGAARFDFPYSVAVDGSGNVYVADCGNSTIRKITPAGKVTTLAGISHFTGSADGAGTAARFFTARGVSVDAAGNVYVADTENHTIRKITASGVVSTVAGLAGSAGATDGTGSSGRFNQPYTIAADSSGNVYVTSFSDHAIRKVTAGGVVTTFAGQSAYGNADGVGGVARLNFPTGVAVDSRGNTYVADTKNHVVRKITSAGVVSTFAGAAGVVGSTNGAGSVARFNRPAGVAVDASGNVYVGDSSNYCVRKITPGGVVSTLASGIPEPIGIALDSVGNVYVAASSNYTINKITPTGVVSVLAGTPGISGSTDGPGSTASFFLPTGVAVDASGNVYVADYLNCTIRKITSAGMVSTLAGTARAGGTNDGQGSAAGFYLPYGVAVDGAGNIYVADTNNHLIRKITAAGLVSTIGGLAGYSGAVDGVGSAARFNLPRGIAVDGAGHVYVADSFSNTIRMGVRPVVLTISTQPANQTVQVEDPVNLSVVASGSPAPVFQWRKDGANIAGATGSSYVIPSAVSANSGGYTVVVSNCDGLVTSDVATVTLTASVILGNAFFTYDGLPHVATASTTPATYPVSFTYNGSANAPTQAGTYIVVATINDPVVQGSATSLLQITKATPVIVWTVPTSVNFGTPLSSAQLSAAANVAGSFVYNPAGGTVLGLGVQTLGASFTPDDTVNFVAASAQRTVTVQVDDRLPVGFDLPSYYARYPDVRASFGGDNYGAWLYYRDHGIYQGEVFDDLFRVEEYLVLYPNLFELFGNDLGTALDHWLSTGRIEGKLGRIPLEFNATGYFTRNPDVAAAVNNDPLLAWGHYWLYGIYEGRAYDDELRVFEYLAINADLTAAFVNDWRQAALHWMRYGRTEGRLGRLALSFNVTEYLNRNPDVLAVYGTNPTTVFLHFWLYGIDENRTYDDLFRPDEYMTRYPDVAAAVGGQRRGAFKHWVRYGLPGGRIGRYP